MYENYPKEQLSGQVPTPVKGYDLKEYFDAKVTKILNRPGFYVVVHDLRAFKSVAVKDLGYPNFARGIANLTIPVGAVVYAPNAVFDTTYSGYSRKMRASFARVDSVFNNAGKKAIGPGVSWFDHNFKYREGTTVTPNSFSMIDDSCLEGIHFYLNVGDAFHH